MKVAVKTRGEKGDAGYMRDGKMDSAEKTQGREEREKMEKEEEE